MPPIRVAEVLAALSLTTDLASGVPVEKGLRTCAVATAFAGCLGLAEPERVAVFHAALLRTVGCTSSAPENAALFDDDLAFQAALKRQLGEFGSWAGPGSWPAARGHHELLTVRRGPGLGSRRCESGTISGRTAGSTAR